MLVTSGREVAVKYQLTLKYFRGTVSPVLVLVIALVRLII